MDLNDLGLEPYSTTATAIGATFGSLTVVQIAKRIGTYRYVAVCRCSCGTFPHVARLDCLKRGDVTSCGCAHLKAITKHNFSGDALYKRWHAMMNRCYDSKNHRYADYGGKGIHVCNRWHEVQNFMQDMKPIFKQGLQLDRIDNHGEYSLANCRWVTSSENNRNKSNNVLVTWKGKTQPIASWADELGVSPFLLYKRIQSYGWTAERAFITPARPIKKSLQIK